MAEEKRCSVIDRKAVVFGYLKHCGITDGEIGKDLAIILQAIADYEEYISKVEIIILLKIWQLGS